MSKGWQGTKYGVQAGQCKGMDMRTKFQTVFLLNSEEKPGETENKCADPEVLLYPKVPAVKK